MEQGEVKMNTKLMITIFTLTLLLISGCRIKTATPIDESAPNNEPIKIGAVYALSGPFASYGIEEKRGLEMAALEINQNGGIDNRKIELIFEDDTGDVQKSVTAVNKLIEVDHVKYIFTAFSSSSQATAPIAEASGVLYMSATVSKIGTGKYVFRDFWDMEDAGRSIGRAINKEGIKNLGILALNYGDTESFLKGLKSTLNNKIQIKEERYDFGETDFKTQLSKLKSFEADGIIVYGFPGAESTKITQQIKELGLDNARLFGSSNYGYTYMHLPLRDTLSKMRLIDVWYSLDPGNIQSQKFITKYNRTYWQDLVGDAAYTYDDLHALAIAMKKRGADADTADIAEALRETNLDGAAGKLTFDTLGNSKRESYLHIYEENGWNKYNTLT